MALSFSNASRVLLVTAWLAACLPASVAAATTPGEPKDVALRLAATGTVTAVDAVSRYISLKGARGQARYRVDPKVANLDQVKVGDRVKVHYVAAMVITLKRGAKDAAPAGEVPAPTAGGDGALVENGTQVTTRVLAVNRAAQTVRLKGPEGRVADLRVQDPADLVGVKAGDRVVAVLHEAVVVDLEPKPR